MNRTSLLNGIVAIAIMAFAFSSCEDDESTPAYVGTWENIETEDFFGVEMIIKSTLVLTKSTFEMTINMIIEGLEAPMEVIKGDFNVNEETFTIYPTTIISYDEQNNQLIIKKGDAGWANALAEMELEETNTATFSIDGNKMTVTFTGDTDSTVYTKK